MQQSMIPRNLWVFHKWEIHEQRKINSWEISPWEQARCTYGMNQSHNNDVMNMNGQWSNDWMNESQKMITQMDKVHINDESDKMMSQIYQMMTEGNQVVEPTPGPSQKLLKSPETVNLTKKSKALNKITRCNTMMEIFLFWVPC